MALLIQFVDDAASTREVPLDFLEAVFRPIEAEGLHFSARVKTPPGTTGFSVGFRDVPSELVGTLHVPL